MRKASEMKVKKEIELSLENIFDILRTYSRLPLPETTRARIYRRVLSKANETAIQLMLPGFHMQAEGFEALPQAVLSDGENMRESLFSLQPHTCFNSDVPPEEPVFIPEQQLELPFP